MVKSIPHPAIIPSRFKLISNHARWNVKLLDMLALQLMTGLVANHRWSVQMTKRKATTPTKPARSQRIAAKAHRANAAIIRSPKPNRLRSVAADPIESSPKGHNDPKQEAHIVESPATALQNSLKQSIPELKNEFNFSSATATARAYQAKLLEMAQANMQFALEFAQRLAAIRSPVDLLRVIEELTNKRIAMFRKYSNEMLELTMK